jgi:SM-20-related protein
MIHALSDDEVAALGEGCAVLREDALSPELRRACAAAVRTLHADGALAPAGIGRAGVVRPDIRSDSLAWVDDRIGDPPFTALHAAFEALRDVVNAQVWLGLRGFSLMVARYGADGAAYARHLDAFKGDPERRFTAIVYLHDAWGPDDGGALVAYEPTGTRVITPAPGRLVMFLADRLEHEVRPAYAERLTATAWFRATP